MLDVKTNIVITVATSDVIPIVTEPKQKRIMTLTNLKGNAIQLRDHHIKRDMITFLEDSGIKTDISSALPGCRGKLELAGVPVKVSPINHVNYDAGAYIKITEADATDESNSRTIIKFLRKNGIDVKRYCKADKGGMSCMRLLEDGVKS